MINELIDGIAVKLNQVFGSGYTIYKENVKQGLTEPCFIIVALEPTQEAKLPNRYFRSYPMDIHYFPLDRNNTKAECYDVAEKLMVELEYITANHNGIDNLHRGIRMRYELVDNVLHFFVNYEFFIKKTMDEVEHMESLERKLNVEE